MLKGMIVTLALVFTMPAFGQSVVSDSQQCGPRDAAVETLTETYNETRRSVALSGVVVVEIYANLATGSWTLLTTNTSGISCVIGAGEEYQETDDPETPTGMKV